MTMTMAWVWLAVAIVLEVSGTVCMKLSDGFERWLPAVLMVLLYMASFAAMVMSLKRLELSVAYAVWAGVGTALVAVVGVMVFREAVTLMKIVAIMLIISGVVMLNLSGSRQ